MRWLLLAAMLPLPVAGQYTLYTCMVTSKGYVVGAKLPPSGIFLKAATGEWRHAGYNHPFINALDYDPRDPGTLYVAAGNGLIRVTGSWRAVEDSDRQRRHRTAGCGGGPQRARHHLFRPYGRHPSHPRWRRDLERCQRRTAPEIHPGDSRGFAHEPAFWWPATKRGSSAARTAANRGRLAGAAGFQVLHIEQSPHDACFWLASTQGGGLFVSTDCGVTFESNGQSGSRPQSLRHRVRSRHRPTASRWPDGASAWRSPKIAARRGSRATPACPPPPCGASPSIPAKPGRIYAGVHEEALYVSQDYGRSPGPGTGWKAAASSHEVRSGGASAMNPPRPFCSCCLSALPLPAATPRLSTSASAS